MVVKEWTFWPKKTLFGVLLENFIVKKWSFWPKSPLFGVLLEIFRGLLEKSSRVRKTGFNGWGWLGNVY